MFPQSGSTLNFTWHLGYPHGGGYRLELVEEGGQVGRKYLMTRIIMLLCR